MDAGAGVYVEHSMTRFPPKAERLQRMNNQLQFLQREVSRILGGGKLFPPPTMSVSALRREIDALREAIALTASEKDE
jgi:prefoldin subunit 5